MKQLDQMHTCEEIGKDTWRIDEGGAVNLYLLAGQEKALLIDAGCGAGYLPTCVKVLTDLPVRVAVTHRHPDHIGGAWEFGSYDASEQDCSFVYSFLSMAVMSHIMVKASGGKVEYPKPFGKHVKINQMKEDQVFDLGGRTVTVRSVPGHTRGSVIFLDEANHLMFTGDDINPCLWMQLPGCTSLQEWKTGANTIIDLMKQGNYTAWYGHGDGRQTLEQMETTYHLVEEIIEKKKAGTLAKGKHLYPVKDQFPNVYYNSKNIL